MTPREEWQWPLQHLGNRVLVFDELDSTNTCAARLAENEPRPLFVLADRQSAGRGQHGRTWQCPAHAGVLMSVLLFPPPEMRRPAVLTAWAAVSVAEVVRHFTGQRARIKWPNDVLIQGRKVCGILIEQGRGTVVGIGLNVRQTPEDFAHLGLPDATALLHWMPANVHNDTVALTLAQRLDEEYGRLLAGDLATLEAAWRERVGLVGQPVVAEAAPQTVRGRLLALTFAAVEVQPPGGALERLAPECVRQLTAEPPQSGPG
jgi:BirA family biotin operon repressor/biotin-[acetyl-CoA-carboxylase] ligase